MGAQAVQVSNNVKLYVRASGVIQWPGLFILAHLHRSKPTTP